MQARVVKALGEIGSETAVPALKRIARIYDELLHAEGLYSEASSTSYHLIGIDRMHLLKEVRKALEKIIGKVEAASFVNSLKVPELRAAMRNGPEMIGTEYFAITDEAEQIENPRLYEISAINRLKSHDPAVRASAAFMLGKIGSEQAIQPLYELAKQLSAWRAPLSDRMDKEEALGALQAISRRLEIRILLDGRCVKVR